MYKQAGMNISLTRKTFDANLQDLRAKSLQNIKAYSFTY